MGLYLALAHHPVVEVVVEHPVSSLEMQVLEDAGVVHQVQTVIHVETFLLGQDQGVFDQLFIGDRRGKVEERVAGLSQTEDT